MDRIELAHYMVNNMERNLRVVFTRLVETISSPVKSLYTTEMVIRFVQLAAELTKIFTRETSSISMDSLIYS
jgi:hypothetical protein